MRMKIGVLVPLRMDVARVPKFVLEWARTSNHLLMVPKEYIDHDKDDRSPGSPWHEFTYFS